MNNIIFTKFGDNDPCCNIGDIWMRCDNPAKVEAEWKEAEKYRWHDLRKDPDDLPEVDPKYSESNFSVNVLVISETWENPFVAFVDLGTKIWYNLFETNEYMYGSYTDVIMWKYIKMPETID